ncbi:MAG: type III PLP-dependent enzyme [Hyphomicrobiaceae bacterium]
MSTITTTAVQLPGKTNNAGKVELAVGGRRASELAEAYGTPSYVYEAAKFRSQLSDLRDAVGDRVDVYFSVKANPNVDVIRIFVEEGAGLEIASAAEYVRARKAGGSPERILFAGPGKTPEELDYVLSNGIGEIHLETEEEIALVCAIAQKLGRRVPVALRINPVSAAQGGSMRMGGKPTQFGFDEEISDRVIDHITAQPSLDLTGVHLFAGTQGLNAETLLDQWAHGINLACRMADRTGQPVKTVDLGGGLGIPYFAGDKPLDLDVIRAHAPKMFDEAAKRPGLHGAKFILEPGRFLAGPGGVYLTRVLSVKESRGSTFVILDGGMHHHLAASGNLGQVIKKDYPIVLANNMEAPLHDTTQVVVGPLCTPLDTLGRKVAMPHVKPGDLIAVQQSGAYGLTASPVGFLSHPMPAEILVDDGVEPKVIRPRGTFEQPVTPLP